MNEITAMPELLAQLAIVGAVVSIDAKACRAEEACKGLSNNSKGHS